MKVKTVHEIVDNAKHRIKEELNKELEHKISQECEKIILALFCDTRDEKTAGHFLRSYKVKTLGGILKETVINAALEKFDEQYKTKIKEVVEGEECIDLIIDRINKKQLK